MPRSLTVKGSLILDNTAITTLPKDLKVVDYVSIKGTPREKLKKLMERAKESQSQNEPLEME